MLLFSRVHYVQYITQSFNNENNKKKIYFLILLINFQIKWNEIDIDNKVKYKHIICFPGLNEIKNHGEYQKKKKFIGLFNKNIFS